MKNILFIICFSIITLSCTERENQKEVEAAALDAMYLKIDKISTNVSCTNADDWKLAAIGSKACGGPLTFIAYHKSIDEAQFLRMVEEFTKAQKAFNEKWGAVSDCSIAVRPKGVSCVDGKAVLRYE